MKLTQIASKLLKSNTRHIMSYFKKNLLSNQFFPLVKVKLGTQKITLWTTKGKKTKTVRQAFEKSFYTKQKKLQQLKESI